MKKAIIVLGSARPDGDTFQVASKLSNGEIPIVDLKPLNISPYDYEHKNIDDDYLPLMEKLLEYDAIILATPVYWYTMSATMKIFFDRLSDLITVRKDLGKKLVGKKIFVVASYGTSKPQHFEEPFRATCDYLKMQYCGCFYYSGRNEELRLDGPLNDFREKIFSQNKENRKGP